MNAVIIHGGTQYPPFLADCIIQFFLFNENSTLYCIVDNFFSELEDLKNTYKNLKIIYTHTLKKSFPHIFFLLFNRMAWNKWRGGFWRYVVERFFILADFMHQFNEVDILHFEYDNLIYVNINELYTKFKNTNKICIPSDYDERCIPGIVYIPSYKFLYKFCNFYNFHYTLKPNNDMMAFSLFQRKKSKYCTLLPVIPNYYVDSKKELISLDGKKSKNPYSFCEKFNQFQGIFDAAAFGQYIGGIDTRYSNNSDENTIGFINKEAIYNVSDFSVKWKYVDKKLKVPFVIYDKKECPIFNLHIHSKHLYRYRSDTQV